MKELIAFYNTEYDNLIKFLKTTESEEDIQDAVRHSITIINGATCFAISMNLVQYNDIFKVFEEYYDKFLSLR